MLRNVKLPVLPLRGIVMFPKTIVPLYVGREKSMGSISIAKSSYGGMILLVTQKDPSVENPARGDLYSVGTICKIIEVIKDKEDESLRVLLQGEERASLQSMIDLGTYYLGEAERLSSNIGNEEEIDDLSKSLVVTFEEYVKETGKVPMEAIRSANRMEDPSILADFIAVNIPIGTEEKQELLETLNVNKRIEMLINILDREIERSRKGMEAEAPGERKSTIVSSFTEEEKERTRPRSPRNDFEELEEKIKKKGMPKEVEEKALEELKRLSMMPPMSAESTVVRNYIEWLISLPWKEKTKDRLDIERAKKILDEDHYGLEKVKERILEFIAVQKLSDRMKGPILCFVGPPGVGKTSLAKSIARALGRKFVRVSFGGVRDEAEIRGHRRTYVGALPGKIIQGMKRAGVVNPVFLMDEIDKLGHDFRGDPAAALLEVLDPEQNYAFNDHYLEVDYDLSNVLFITTANVLHTIPPPLLDRMEVIRLPGYIEEEKIQIARHFLIPKEMKANGLAGKKVTFTTGSIIKLIRNYTREAGVRNLQREIGNICRKIARKMVEKGQEEKPVRVTAKMVENLLGPPRYKDQEAGKADEIGVAQGLAWTETGGEILAIETAVMKGKGNLIITGKLGDVMQESAKAALSYVRTRAAYLNIPENFYKNTDIHIHVPEGAIPKDGPSAGITMAISIISALSKVPVRKDVAMTGEITLRGKVLPIGGLKEKLIAAYRAGIKKVIIPKENEKDLRDVPKKVLKNIKIILVEHMDEVIREALVLEGLLSKPFTPPIERPILWNQ